MIEKLHIAALFPELILLVMAMAIAMIDLFDTSVRRHTTYVLTLMTLVLVAVLQAFDASAGETIYSFGNMVVSDPMGNWLKCFSTLSIINLLISSHSMQNSVEKIDQRLLHRIHRCLFFGSCPSNSNMHLSPTK